METVSRRTLIKAGMAAGLGAALTGRQEGRAAARPKLKDVGWVWEGQGLDPGVYPSIFGVGEGAKYFGIDRAVYIFHPNDELAMEKLKPLKEVTCDITKWKFKNTEDGRGTTQWADSKPEAVKKEAEHVSQLSLKYPNITGVFHDDMWGLVKREGYGPEQYGEIYKAAKSANPKLRHWVVVYTKELGEGWKAFAPYIDVVNLWEWKSTDLPGLDEKIARCREVFPGKPINLGCYLRDYTLRQPVAMNNLKSQWESVLRGVSNGTLAGFSILAAVLIDGHQEQARWIRDFIKANS